MQTELCTVAESDTLSIFVKEKSFQQERAPIPRSGLSFASVNIAVAMLFCLFPVI